MRWPRLIPALCIAMTLAGCAARGAAVGRADAEVLAAVRDDLRRTDPGAIVGIVRETIATGRWAAVTDVPLERFRVGQTITFIDANQRRLTHGHVRRITRSELHVQYDPPPRGGRMPRVGDLAVKFEPR